MIWVFGPSVGVVLQLHHSFWLVCVGLCIVLCLCQCFWRVASASCSLWNVSCATYAVRHQDIPSEIFPDKIIARMVHTHPKRRVISEVSHCPILRSRLHGRLSELCSLWGPHYSTKFDLIFQEHPPPPPTSACYFLA